jgi:signal transduction histidine kinase
MLFILVSYFAFNSTRKAEQNQVWVGMSKETAHQLGTPISSLLAWLEFLKLKNSDAELLSEVEKDIKRLETITERFSKIGSTPVLKKANIADVLNNSITYLKTRSSKKIKYILNFSSEDEIFVSINIALFEWVIENICKNAMDAMEGDGTIDITVTDNTQVIYLDIKDTGKGIPKSKYKTIFHPGFTTKQRGWGLGLSLTKRIVEIYHSGKIFVKNSELNRETTFRIVLKK